MRILLAFFTEATASIVDVCVSFFSRQKKPSYTHIVSKNPTVTECVWIGHATMLINMRGTTILTDPVFSDRVLVLRRKIKAPVTIKQLPAIDVVLLSHAHFDHLDMRSLRKLDKHHSCTFVVPAGYAALLRSFRNTVVELKHKKTVAVHNVTVTAHKPQHWSSRWPWQRVQHYNAYTMQKNNKTIFFAGDTAYKKRLHEVFGQADTVIMPIGAYTPAVLEAVHQTPEQALLLAEQMQAKTFIPMHYATFKLAFEPLDEPLQRLQANKHLFSGSVLTPAIGQKITLLK